jgi:hypothetical protein
VIGADGTDERTLTASAAPPAWSPDGSRVVFTNGPIPTKARLAGRLLRLLDPLASRLVWYACLVLGPLAVYLGFRSFRHENARVCAIAGMLLGALTVAYAAHWLFPSVVAY